MTKRSAPVSWLGVLSAPFNSLAPTHRDAAVLLAVGEIIIILLLMLRRSEIHRI